MTQEILNDFFKEEETKLCEEEVKINELRLVKDKVEAILSKSNKACNSDKSLISQYLKEFHEIELSEEELSEIPSFESITRCRRKFQEKGLYTSDPEVEQTKYLYEEQVRVWSKE